MDAAKDLGHTALQSLRQVTVPLALPVLMADFRLSALYVLDWATLDSYIGAGGLGDYIFNGLLLFQPDLLLGGTLPVTLLAHIVHWLLGRYTYHLTPVSERA